MLSFLFYGWTSLALVFEFHAVIEPAKHVAMLERLKTKAQNANKNIAGLIFLYWCWMFIGFFTSQWFLFVVFFCWSILFWNIFKIKKEGFAVSIDGYISVVLLLLIVLNRYHLHIDFLQLLINLFN